VQEPLDLVCPVGAYKPGQHRQSEKPAVKTAVVTFVYNEFFNLPIWIRHYGANFGDRNLFVVDLGTNDGSTDNLGEVNRIPLPRESFDEFQKTGFINALCKGLLLYYDTVIYTDGDEIIVPDLSIYPSLKDYVEQRDFDYTSCVGLNVLHIISQEDPLDLSKPILPQRRYALFHSAQCKPLITRVPMNWTPGFHCGDKPPQIDPNLYVFHTKMMDYTLSMARHKVSREASYSQRTVEAGMGAHSRYSNERFVRECFFDPLNTLAQRGPEPFDFSEEIAKINAGVSESGGVHFIPMNIMKLVEIPEHLKGGF
jgi:hypothetical protein